MRSVEPHVLATVGETLAARGYFQMILRRNGRAFATHRRRSVFDTLQTVLDMFRGRQPLSESRMALCLTQALTAMAEPAAPEISSDRTSLIDRAVGCISQRIGCEPSVGELARLVGWSEYHFIRVFREMMGVTPRRYIIVNRMNHVRYLLKTTALPIGEIGGMVGYASESMFSAAFRRTHGITPSQYRTGEQHPEQEESQ
ncbi:MAG: helix-turn-helix transcriptional regulator [Aristaeellaceae bacterium]